RRAFSENSIGHSRRAGHADWPGPRFYADAVAMTDDAAHQRRRAIIAELKAQALDVARTIPRPKNPRAYVIAEVVRALADHYLSGRRQPSPRAREIADRIRAHAERGRRR